jgi:hypothetical protein
MEIMETEGREEKTGSHTTPASGSRGEVDL